MKILEMDRDGNYKDANSKRIRYTVDDKGKVVEEYEIYTDYGLLVAGNLQDFYNNLAERAKEGMRTKRTSPLEYCMYLAQIELPHVMAETGFTRRQVRKHMKPEAFNSLDDAVLQRYADAFRMDINTIKALRENHHEQKK